MSRVDPAAPCLIGVATRTWRAAEVGEDGAPEPLEMWAEVLEAAGEDTGAGRSVLDALGSLTVVYCQTWQYDDPAGRLAARLGLSPARAVYTGIGGTVPAVAVAEAAEAMRRSDLEVAAVVSGEALATRRRRTRAGLRYQASFPPAQRAPFPFEAPFHPAEVAHEVFQAYLTFALFDSAHRAHRGVPLGAHRAELGRLWARACEVAAANPDAWFRQARTAEEIAAPGPDNRMVAYPYTKRMVAIMDVDMAAALILATHRAADRLGVPSERRVYLRGAGFALDPTYVAEHPGMWRSPAMRVAAGAALRTAGIGIDDVAHLDLYSCFGSSVTFALDALGLDAGDSRGFTLTGGLPYHGGPGSGYLTHSLAWMGRRLRADPGSYALVSGVGMHMTKHAYLCWSTTPPAAAGPWVGRAGESPTRPIVERVDGPATVVAYTVLHDRAGEPERLVAVCETDDGTRSYACGTDGGLLTEAENVELIGRRVVLRSDDAGVNRLTSVGAGRGSAGR